MRLLRVAAVLLIIHITLLPALVYSLASTPSIVISQFKVTSKDGQFFMLYNNTDKPIDMGTVQLVYYNHYDFAAATSSKIIGLTGQLEAGGYYLVNDGPYILCHQMAVNSVSLNFSSTKGSVQVARLNQADAGQPITSEIQDSVSWSKSEVEGVTTQPSNTNEFLLRAPLTAENNPDITAAGTGTWQVVAPDADDACHYSSTEVTDPEPRVPQVLELLSPTPPPVTILSLFSASETVVNRNAGLMAPVINEILPNPASPLTDSEDEFIEIYNPNDANFDLTDFAIQVGTTTKRTWTFPDGMQLGPKSFSVFTSSEFSVSLTNSGGQVALLDPNGQVISQTKEYGKAKDNYAWALAEGEWYWTVQPTPGKPNVMSAGNTGANGEVTLASTGETLGSYTSAAGANGASVTSLENPQVTTLHPTSLASVAALAVGYGAYEYKHDIANKYRQLRSNRAARRKNS